MDQAALGPFEVPQREAVWYAAEEERRLFGCEDAGWHGNLGWRKKLAVSSVSFVMSMLDLFYFIFIRWLKKVDSPMPFQQLLTGTGRLNFRACLDFEERKKGQVCVACSCPSMSLNAKVS